MLWGWLGFLCRVSEGRGLIPALILKTLYIRCL